MIDFELSGDEMVPRVRDALLLWRAAERGDTESTRQICANMTDPAISAALLAGWLADEVAKPGGAEQ